MGLGGNAGPFSIGCGSGGRRSGWYGMLRNVLRLLAGGRIPDREPARRRAMPLDGTGFDRVAPGPMLSPSQLATLNLEEARTLRAAGHSYRQIGRRLKISSGQLSHIRRALKREKAAATRLRSRTPGASDRDLPVNGSVLPPGLRRILVAGGYRTLGDLADRLADPDRPGFEAMPGIGRHRAELVTRLLDHYGLVPAVDDLKAAVARVFPDFG